MTDVFDGRSRLETCGLYREGVARRLARSLMVQIGEYPTAQRSFSNAVGTVRAVDETLGIALVDFGFQWWLPATDARFPWEFLIPVSREAT